MKKVISFILAAAAVCSLMTGCGSAGESTPQPPRNVACVVGVTNNNPRVESTLIDELTGLSASPGSTYTVINAESEPQVICSGQIADLSDRGYSEAMLERIRSSVTADISGRIDTASPRSPEVDIAAATALAVRSLRAQEAEGRDNLLVYYLSGISTCGVIDMVSVPVFQMDTEASVQALTGSLELDLQGIDVVMYCCGDTAGTAQPALSVSERNKLQEFYRTLFLALGARSVSFMEDIPAGEGYSFDQPVSVMETENTTGVLLGAVVDAGEAEDREVEETFNGGDILSFDEKTIAFEPDSTELADPDAAREALSYVIEYMLAHPDFELLICGTTTSAGEEGSCIRFSEKRAESVRAVLAAVEGIDSSRIHIVGCGYSSVLYIPDRMADGSLDNNVAPRNRSVKLVDYNSDTAAQILNSLPAS